MAASLKFVALVGATLASLTWYLEKNAALLLPAPSFKPIGPLQQPTIPAPMEGIFAPNNHLHKAEVLYKNQVHGSETVDVSPDGYLYMTDRFGNVLRAKHGKGSQPEHVTHLGAGHPLGFRFSSDGDLYVCNAPTGLQKIEKSTGKVVLLSSLAPESPGSKKQAPILFADDLSIASDGGVYFTDASSIPPAYNEKGFYDIIGAFILTLLQGEHTGRLLHYSPNGKTTCIAKDFFFPNGVELDHDESSALVVETGGVKVTRVWLKGPKAGSRETFLDKLPGYPDGIVKGQDGTFWVAIVSVRQPMLEMLLYSRITRWLVPKVPGGLEKGTAVIQVSSTGKILRYLADPDDSVVASVTAVAETKEGLYLGNVQGNNVAFLARKNYPPLLS